MLGAAQTAALAGWWGGEAPVIVDMTLTFTVDILQPTLVSPRYVADFNGVSDPGAAIVSILIGTGNVYDNAGIGTQAKQSIHSITFKVGDDWMVSAPTDQLVTGFTSFLNFDNLDTDSYYQVSVFKNNNQYNIGWSGGAVITFTPAQFEAYRNRWLGTVLATSNTSNSFSSWTAGSPEDPEQMASRIILVDIATGDVIAQDDAWYYSAQESQDFGNIDLTQTWTFGFESSANRWVNDFTSMDGNAIQYDRNQFELGSRWFAVGDTIDPVDHYLELIGWGIQPEVQGIQSWSIWLFDEPGTPLTANVIYAYEQPYYSGSRSPANAYIRTENSYDVADPPVFTKIS